MYALVSADSPAALGLPMLAAGVGASIAAVALASRTSVRTRYRPDPWRLPEWLVAGAGVVTAGLLAAASWLGVAALTAPTDPPGWPALPLVGLLAAAIAATPALTAPPLPLNVRHQRSTATRVPEPVA